jgi:D-alanine-D-alanine ligase
MRIAVLMGGTSAERDVSLASGIAIVKALRERSHEVVTIDTASGFVPAEREADLLPGGVRQAPPESVEHRIEPIDLASLPELRSAELAFLALHGGVGEDGTLQALLELMGIPYTGSRPLGSGIAMDKDVSKRLLRDAQVPTLPWRVARGPEFAYDPDTIEDLVGIPCVVKPSREGSSVGLHVVRRREELEPAVADAARYDSEVMIERYVRGRELTVSIVGDQPLPPIEIRPRKGIYDYESKYTPGMTEYLCPAPLDEEMVAELQMYALRAFKVLKLRQYARVDFILAKEQLWCLEANTLPGMTATSLLPKAAAAAGMDFPELCDRIARLAAGEDEPGTRGGDRG